MRTGSLWVQHRHRKSSDHHESKQGEPFFSRPAPQGLSQRLDGWDQF